MIYNLEQRQAILPRVTLDTQPLARSSADQLSPAKMRTAQLSPAQSTKPQNYYLNK